MKKQQEALELFKRLVAIPAPSGHEAQIGAEISAIIKEFGFTPERDAVGNVFVRIKGKADRGLTMLAAHMDEIGLTVKAILPDGSLTIEALGGLHPWKLGERPMTILGSQTHLTGIVSAGAGHGADASKPITWANYKVVTGRSVEELEAAGVRPGTSMVPLNHERGPIILGVGDDPLVAAWTFDDRMGVVALLRLLQRIKAGKIKPLTNLMVAFTVQEELGGLGIKVLAGRERPQALIAIDGTPMQPHAGLLLDGRPGMWARDALALYNAELMDAIDRSAAKAGTSMQVAALVGSASDASMAAANGLVELAADFGHVRENSHGYEIARLSVFDNVLNVLVEFVKTWEGWRA